MHVQGLARTGVQREVHWTEDGRQVVESVGWRRVGHERGVQSVFRDGVDRNDSPRFPDQQG